MDCVSNANIKPMGVVVDSIALEYVLEKEYEHSSSGYIELVEDCKVFEAPLEALIELKSLPEYHKEYSEEVKHECIVRYRVIVREKSIQR